MSFVTVSIGPSFFSGGGWIATLNREIDQWSHTISAFGGFTSASFKYTANRQQLEDWWEYGLGRHVQAFDQSGGLIWEGFVNQITVSVGAYQLTQGPMVDITNKLSAYYSELTRDGDGNVGQGDQKRFTDVWPDTDGVTDTDRRALVSQRRFGVWQRRLSIGQVFPEDADQITKAYLREHCWPEMAGGSFELGRAGDNSVQVECLGYQAFLGAYTYTSESSEIVTLSDKLKAVLKADANRVINRDFRKIEDNYSLTAMTETEDARADAIIKSITSLGDGQDRRWLFGIYEDRLAEYRPVDNVVSYLQYLYDPRQTIVDIAGPEVKPWNVRPGVWLMFPDLVPMATHDFNNPRDDLAAMFIEQVSYTTPYSLSLTGSKVSSLAQKLQRLGLGGISA